MQNYSIKIGSQLSIKPTQVASVMNLLDEGSTIPFISRYRKEMTGGLDETFVTSIRDLLEKLRELDKRREAILKSLEERELLTDELKDAIMAAEEMNVLEDIYLPYKPKRRTRATKAREMGLEPLALLIFEQRDDIVPDKEAEAFIDKEKGVDNIEIALQGARDIIAEMINEDADTRGKLRDFFKNKAIARSKVIKGQEEMGAKFSDYFEYEEPVKSIAGHRILAVFRGEREAFLRLKVQPEREDAVELIKDSWVKGTNPSSLEVFQALEDSYKRLLAVSLENELRNELKEKADIEAIAVFAGNLRELLLYPPYGQRPVMAVDPAFRTGCKIVMLDAHGKLLTNTTIFPTTGKSEQAEAVVVELCDQYKPHAVAIGNGTASRETESFFRSLKLNGNPEIVVVNESGASVYSASEAARREFPDYDLTVRGAVSIGRRLQDPLAELVKIDPKAIGVGQYQHDVEQTLLKKSLDDVVVSCVNTVGVELNSASMELLTYVSGLGQSLAENIIKMREENGPFPSRKALLEVPRLGPKAFEQAAGFLRVQMSDNPLDRSAVHPESYAVVQRMAEDAGCTISELMEDDKRRKSIDLKNYVDDKTGLPTLHDIMSELEKPGRDPRGEFESFSFMEGVEKMSDLEVGAELPGIVTNVTNFGAFVDIGVHQDGLVHISELADRFVKDPLDVVKVHQKVKVRVLEVDEKRKRISLSMKKGIKSAPQKAKKKMPPKDKILKPEDLNPTNGIRIGRLKKK